MVLTSCALLKQQKQHMKKLLTLIATVALSIGANAACGKKVTNEGTLKSYDAEKKTVVVVDAAGKSATITLTPSTTGADKVKDLVGKAVKVVSEHGKADSVAAKS
jgi:hypothetical protein